MAPTIVRRIGEMAEMGWLRHRLALTHASRDYDGTVMMSHKMGLPVFAEGDLDHLRAPNSTLFILGSGESVEEVTPRQWDFVRSSASIGINSWAVQD